MKIRAIQIVFLLFSLLNAEALFVGLTGIDAEGNGAQSTPYKTIGYAMNAATPGDTVYVLPGTYRNSGYGSSSKENGNIAYITNVHGEPGKEIVLKSFNPLEAKLQFDGSGALIFSHVSYLVIDGFEIEGPGASIDTADARSHRLDDPVLSYYSGRGIAFWGKEGNHHITIQNNRVHHCPNSGIRANFVDYIAIENNEVYANCWWSPNAESGIVIAQATNIDSSDEVKIILRNNRVWDNGNYVVYFNPKYGDGDGYGQPGYTNIVDGQGLYITRSNDTYLAGKILIENNISVNNGINGIGFHHTNRGIIRNNTLYKNGQYPERPVSGITLNGADQVAVYNNIVVGRDDIVLQNYEGSTNVSVKNNLIWDGTNGFDSGATLADPLFVAPALLPESWDFSLQKSSPAVDAAIDPTPETDIYGTPRPSGSAADIGAVELVQTAVVSGMSASSFSARYSIAAVTNGFQVNCNSPVDFSIRSLLGRELLSMRIVSSTVVSHALPRGVYVASFTKGEQSMYSRLVVVK